MADNWLDVRALLFYRKRMLRRTAMKKIPQGDALKKLANDLGVSFHASAT